MTELRDISVHAPDELTEAEIEIGGPYVVGTWRHLLSAQGWIEHTDCAGHGCELDFEGLVPPGDVVASIAKHVGSETDLVREALIEVERVRAEGDADVALDSGDGSDSPGVVTPLRSVDAETGPSPDQTLD